MPAGRDRQSVLRGRGVRLRAAARPCELRQVARPAARRPLERHLLWGAEPRPADRPVRARRPPRDRSGDARAWLLEARPENGSGGARAVSAGTARSDARARKAKGLIAFKPLSRRRRRKPLSWPRRRQCYRSTRDQVTLVSEVMSPRCARKLGGAARGASQSNSTARKAKELVSGKELRRKPLHGLAVGNASTQPGIKSRRF